MRFISVVDVTAADLATPSAASRSRSIRLAGERELQMQSIEIRRMTARSVAGTGRGR